MAHQAPLSMGFSRQEYWSGLPFPSPGDLPDPGTEPRSPSLQADALPSSYLIPLFFIIAFHFQISYKISAEKLFDGLIGVSLCVMNPFSLAAFKILFVFGF